MAHIAVVLIFPCGETTINNNKEVIIQLVLGLAKVTCHYKKKIILNKMQLSLCLDQ